MDSHSGIDIAAIAASAGGIKALGAVLHDLPADLDVAVVVVQHLDRQHRTVIADVLSRHATMPVKLAEAGETARAGTIYIAPPDWHLLVERSGLLSLTGTELVHFVRPSADLLFESVAAAFGDRAIAVVLTGSGRDGATGVRAIKAHGGTVIVEDPSTAEFAGMPSAALETGDADFVLPLREIGPAIVRLVQDSQVDG